MGKEKEMSGDMNSTISTNGAVYWVKYRSED